MPTPTKRFMNVVACSFTPTGGTAITITGISSVEVNPGATEQSAAGDGDIFPTLRVYAEQDPQVTINTNEPAQLNSVPIGTVGTLTWTTPDARNGVVPAGGGVAYTLSNACFGGNTTTHPHRQFATGTPLFRSFSTDGTTNPLAASAL